MNERMSCSVIGTIRVIVTSRNVQILHIAFPDQLTFCKHVLDVFGDDRTLSTEKICHLRLGQPDGLMLQTYIDTHTAAWIGFQGRSSLFDGETLQLRPESSRPVMLGGARARAQ